ncbi:MAG: hypothetical protein IJW03_04805 [Clostridia bacterium]|nr:hypothetical protein [Clostridia bacterium]
MRKFLAIIMIMAAIFTLSACAKDNDAPEGLELADENAKYGYIFYAPEGWTVSNRADVSAAYVTAVNMTSISFTPAEAPSVPLTQYFDESMEKLPYEITMLKHGEACTFGNASSATKFIYTYKYQDYSFAAMQILVSFNEGFYIFTYNSYGDPSDSASDYQKYLTSVQLAIDNFKFTSPTESDEASEYAKDSDGYNLVSDRRIAGFDLYLPESYEVIDNGAMVSAEISAGANVSITKASQTGVSVLTYIENRRAELASVVSDITDIKVGVPKAVDTNGEFFEDWSLDVLPELDETIVFGNLKRESIVSYEYTYVFAGKTYHVYQILGVDGYNGYVFTYTALDGEYSEHIEEIMTILGKVDF